MNKIKLSRLVGAYIVLILLYSITPTSISFLKPAMSWLLLALLVAIFVVSLEWLVNI